MNTRRYLTPGFVTGLCLTPRSCKSSGGHHRDNDSQALRLQQQYKSKDYP